MLILFYGPTLTFILDYWKNLQLGYASEKSPFARRISFVMVRLLVYFTVITLSFPARATGIFLGSSQWKPSGDSKTQSPWKCGGPHKTAALGVLTLNASPYSVSSCSTKLAFPCSYQFMAPAAFGPGQQVLPVSLWMNLPLQTFAWQCVLKPQFSDGLKSRHGFSVGLAFSCCRDSSGNFQGFHLLEWTQKP